jgi:peptide-methionine (S)-S-oxide reductase
MKKYKSIITLFILVFAFSATINAAGLTVKTEMKKNQNKIEGNKNKMDKQETAILGAGCFWCVEAIFQKLNGVISVEPGYAGGYVANPSYEAVCTGKTGHAEVAKIVFNPKIISYEDLLKVFFEIHDPTTLNRQGNDVGEQYRSVIFYTTSGQKTIAEKVKSELEKSGYYQKPIVTQIEPLKHFYEAEDYHKNYYENNKDKPYCQFVISPKVKKFEKLFSDKIIKK